MNLDPKFKPMLACDADPDTLDDLPYPMAMFIKYDGVRTLHIHGNYGRSMKLHANPYLQGIFNKPEYFGFDSEGIVGDPLAPDCISVSSGGYSRQKDKPKENKFVKVDAICYVFDDFTYPKDMYKDRFTRATRRVNELLAADPSAPFRMAEMFMVNNKEELLALWARADDEGHEGLIGRSMHATYKFGRATKKEMSFLRFKSFEEREGIIEGFEEGATNTNEAKKNELGQTERSTKKAGMVPNGQIASLFVRNLKTGELEKIASGCMTVAEATAWFENFDEIKGKIAKYKVFAKGTGNFTKPRFPTFQCIRSPEDM
jgi:DNA ligase-1